MGKLEEDALYEECWNCYGTGFDEDKVELFICDVCNGIGYLPHEHTEARDSSRDKTL